MEILATSYNESIIYVIANTYQNFNNTIKNPFEVPELYEISNNVKELKIIYESILKENKNNKLIQEIKNYFNTYEENEEREQDAIKLIEQSKKIIELKNNNNYIYILSTSIILLITITIVLYYKFS